MPKFNASYNIRPSILHGYPNLWILKISIYEAEIAIGISDQIKWFYFKKNVYIIYYSTTLNWYIIYILIMIAT